MSGHWRSDSHNHDRHQHMIILEIGHLKLEDWERSDVLLMSRSMHSPRKKRNFLLKQYDTHGEFYHHQNREYPVYPVHNEGRFIRIALHGLTVPGGSLAILKVTVHTHWRTSIRDSTFPARTRSDRNPSSCCHSTDSSRLGPTETGLNHSEDFAQLGESTDNALSGSSIYGNSRERCGAPSNSCLDDETSTEHTVRKKIVTHCLLRLTCNSWRQESVFNVTEHCF